MPDVECRPELHHATTEQQYDEFHAGMKQFGLGRTLIRDGKVWKLPTGLYLGLNLSTSFDLLDVKINALAVQITGHRCKLFLSYVDAATVYFSGLEEDTSFEAQLSLFAISHYSTPAPWPTGHSLRAMMERAGTQPEPATMPNFSALASVMDYSKP